MRPGELAASPFNVGADEVGDIVLLSYGAYGGSKPDCRYAVWSANVASVESRRSARRACTLLSGVVSSAATVHM